MAEFRPAYLKLRSLEGYYLLDGDGDSYAGICRKYWPDSAVWNYVDAEKPLKNGQKLKNKKAESTIEVFYFCHYWKDTLLSYINNQNVATFLFCQSVNEGNEAIKIAQRIVGVKEDGVLGPITLEAINDFGDIENDLVEDNISYYHQIVNSNPSKAKYLKGWINRINNIVNS